MERFSCPCSQGSLKKKKKKRRIKPTETECEMCNKDMTKGEPYGQLEKALGKVTSELCFKEVKFHQMNQEGKREIIPDRGVEGQFQQWVGSEPVLCSMSGNLLVT